MMTVIGMGDDGIAGLGDAARALITSADILVGSSRLLALIPESKAERITWPAPFDPLAERLAREAGHVVILATGDPMHYGIGATLARHLPQGFQVIPAPSAFSLAAARLGWPLDQCATVSLHGRDAALIEPLVQPCRRILALTAGDETVRTVARRLTARGWGKSALIVLEHMGGAAERIVRFTAADAPEHAFAAFATLAIEALPDPGTRLLPAVPGLPDDAFLHDGQLTKREIRAVTLAALAPTPGARLWDVGAGCGSIAIEWMRAADRATATAIEPDEARRAMIAENADRLGTPGLVIIAGRAPDALEGLTTPDAVFLGGAVADEAIFATAWAALPAGGRLVANAVTLEGEAALIARHANHGGELVRMDVAHAGPVGRLRALYPRMAVLQWRVVKP